MKIERSLPPLQEGELLKIEELIGSCLPTDYRSFLLAQNGGKPSPAGFRFNREGGGYSESSVEWLYGIKEDGDLFNSFELHYRGSLGRMPPNIIPIGSDAGGNQICISVSEHDQGHVFFWDHEKESDPDEDEEPGHDNLYLLADSFSVFLRNLFD